MQDAIVGNALQILVLPKDTIPSNYRSGNSRGGKDFLEKTPVDAGAEESGEVPREPIGRPVPDPVLVAVHRTTVLTAFLSILLKYVFITRSAGHGSRHSTRSIHFASMGDGESSTTGGLGCSERQQKDGFLENGHVEFLSQDTMVWVGRWVKFGLGWVG